MTSGQSINKEVKALDSPYVGDVVRETDDKIVVFGHCDYRFDIPKSEIVAAGRNIIVGMDFPAILKYRIWLMLLLVILVLYFHFLTNN